ncbi:E3 ubiquitin-protein ligase TRIM45-like [Mytilus trossulus]|uniref:E3 ubiquitin-protein ligase TRIM45-like n=1 Tax=Mytilus trossulus TaxID=6551 RepID=UPI003005CF4E
MAEISVSSPGSYSCGICQSELCNPKILKCFHVFCRRCLDQVSDSRLLQWSNRITCPLCESVTYITWKGFDELDDFKYLYQSKNEQSKSQCEMCDKNNIAASKCEDCQEFMCKECHDYHKMHKKFKSHSVVSLDTQDVETVLKDDACMQVATIEKMCKEHYVPHPIQEFCKACSKPVCAFCMSGSHNGHDTDKFQTIVVNARTSLKVASKALESKLPFLESLLNEAHLEKAKYNNHIRNTRAEIQETSERLKQEICRKIDGITRENISKLDSMEQADNAVLESYRKDVARSKMAIEGLLYMTENLLKFGDKNDLIEAFMELQTRLSHYGHNYGVIMPDIFEPLMKPGSIKLNELYEAVGSIERDKKPMTNSFIAFKQQPSSHLVDNDKAFTKVHSFNLGYSVDSVVCTFSTDVVLVLQGINITVDIPNGINSIEYLFHQIAL